MFDLVLIFSILIASYIICKYICNSLSLENRKKDISSFSVVAYLVLFIFLIAGIIGENNYIVFPSFLLIIVILTKEMIISFRKINYYNKKFKDILRNKDYNVNVSETKKGMIADSIYNIFFLLSSPFIVLEKFIQSILSLIF